MSDSAAYLRELQQDIIDHFNWSEIEDLCLRLNIDYEIAPGTDKPRWLRGILYTLARDGRLPELVTLTQKERPKTVWPPVPDDFEIPASLSPMRSQQEELRDYVRTAVATYTARMNQAVLQTMRSRTNLSTRLILRTRISFSAVVVRSKVCMRQS